MKTHLKLANDDSRSDTLLVFLPGAFLKPEEFEREGFVSAVRERDLAADALLVDADVSYYYDQTFIERLHHDILQPQRATGYKSIWLVGISIGGFGALIHELAKPGAVDGIVALAPYLGRRPLGAEIHKAGGLRAWKAPEGPPPDEEVDRKLWPWLQQYAAPQPAKDLPPLYLGFGLADRFASNHRLLADALPAGPRVHHRRRPRLAAVVAAVAQGARRAAAALARDAEAHLSELRLRRGSEASGHRGLTSKA